MTTTDDTLTVTIRDGVYTVSDTSGGIWWPNDEAAEQIEAANDPEARALEICRTTPMRGQWRF